MKKGELYLSLCVAIILTIYYGMNVSEIRKVSTKSDFVFNIPRVEPIVVKTFNLNSVSNFNVWNVKPVNKKEMNGVSKMYSTKTEKNHILFILKKIDGIPTLVNAYNEKYRWEFFGTIRTDKGRCAVFFNPALKENGLKVLKSGMNLDKYLVLKDIGFDNVTVELKVDKTTKNFMISIFNVNINKLQKEVGSK